MSTLSLKKLLLTFLAMTAVAGLLILGGCKRGGNRGAEFAYVAAGQVNLRDRVAPVFNKTGAVTNGERVEVLERSKNGRFVRVRSPRDEEGWMEQRYLTNQSNFDKFQVIASENAGWPLQGRATTRASLNMHAEPQRDSAHLYQLKEGEQLELLKRAVSQRAIPDTPQGTASPTTPAELVLEDWWLARDSNRHTGWVLSRILDIEAPLEVAQYAEGQRIIACFVLNQVHDDGRQVPQYLMLLNEPKDGSPVDFNQVRIFTWNAKRDRYETAYRERNVTGMLPVTTGFQDFENEGKLPIFTLSLKDASGNLHSLTYKMNGVVVKKVVAPEEASKVETSKVPAKLPKPGNPRPSTAPQQQRQ